MNLPLQFYRLCSVFFDSSSIKQLISLKHLSLSFFMLNRDLSKITKNIKTIFDIGANQGQFAIAAKYRFPDSTIYSFEPVPETYETLSRNVSAIKGIHTFNFGLGSKNQEIIFYKNAHSHASSALPISDFQKTEIPETAITEEIKVPVRVLDSVVKDLKSLDTPILIKLDVQGYEKEVLKGAISFIDQVEYLLFETSFEQMYEGEPLFDEMHSYVCKLGFSLIGPIGLQYTDSGRIVQMDVLYHKRK